MEEVTRNNPLVSHPELWSCMDEQGAEIETSDFMYSLVRLLKPKVVVETGTYFAQTTLSIVHAIEENKNGGFLFTAEVDKDRYTDCYELLRRPIKENLCDLFYGKGIDMLQKVNNPIDIAFIDSGDLETRRQEFIDISNRMSPFGIIALHDTAPQHSYNQIEHDSYGFIKMYMNTPRGLTLFQSKNEPNYAV